MASAKTVPIRHAEVAHALPVSAAARARQLEQVLEQIGEAIIVKDLDAVVTYWNREAASLYGYSAEDAIGRPLRKLRALIFPKPSTRGCSSACGPENRPRRPASGARRAAMRAAQATLEAKLPATRLTLAPGR